jgi:hypothetical protein
MNYYVNTRFPFEITETEKNIPLSNLHHDIEIARYYQSEMYIKQYNSQKDSTPRKHHKFLRNKIKKHQKRQMKIKSDFPEYFV